MKLTSLILLALVVAGCLAPLAQRTFPTANLRPSDKPQWFDMNHDGKNDFAITFDSAGRVDALWYDDNEDGQPDRIFHLRDYADGSVPHLIVLLDSIPYSCVAERYAAGD